MRTENFTFLSDDGKTKIHAVKWLPDNGRPEAVLQITHGMVEYIERYRPFAEYMTAHGYLVVGHDHVGHGQSVRFKGDWGYFREKDPSGMLVEDIHTLYQMTRKEYPGLPYYLFGHSMGSYILRKYLTIYPEDLTGAIICGTGYMPVPVTTAGLCLIRVMKLFKGSHYRSSFVTGMTFGKAYSRYDLTGKDPSNSWLTKNEEIVTRYYKDPACTYTFTLNGYQGLLECVLYDCRQKNADAIPSDLPLLLVSGADDPVGDAGDGVRKVYEMLQKKERPSLTMKLYEDDRHEILNETNREEVYADLLAWMNAPEGR